MQHLAAVASRGAIAFGGPSRPRSHPRVRGGVPDLLDSLAGPPASSDAACVDGQDPPLLYVVRRKDTGRKRDKVG
uniref:Predicted protein n=1 Tax=Hordeum vulgare subsp. vulgare TaxID=112509 RepID=F2D0V5_HORVV|nr:predicted protein [Hordeum vulgare subsp. vulgare]